MYYHFRKHWIPYVRLRRKDDQSAICPFCDEGKITPRIIAETAHAYVMPNRLAYDQWELRPVLEHLLLVPKQHVRKLSELSTEAQRDIMQCLAKYDALDYEIYMRATTNVQRSVGHQHTHLLKTGTKRSRGMLFLRKPYILWRLP